MNECYSGTHQGMYFMDIYLRQTNGCIIDSLDPADHRRGTWQPKALQLG